MLPNSVPEIQRMNLSMIVLTLKAMGINDLLHFDFMDPPPVNTLVTALELLYQLGALDNEGLLTRIGRKMAEFPLAPELSKMLMFSVDLGCSEEVLTIVAMLAAQNIFYRPKDKQQQADQKKSKFNQNEGDHLTLLVVYNSWKSSGFSNTWCSDNFIQARSLKRAQDVRKQLLGIMEKYKQDIMSCGKNYEMVRKAICGGYFRNAAKKDSQEGYKTVVEGTPVHIHPSSAAFGKQPDWVIYHELVLTSKEYMREVVTIEPKWLTEVAPNFFTIVSVLLFQYSLVLTLLVLPINVQTGRSKQGQGEPRQKVGTVIWKMGQVQAGRQKGCQSCSQSVQSAKLLAGCSSKAALIAAIPIIILYLAQYI